LTDAQLFCERVRRKIEKTVVHYDSQDIQITVSIGLAQFSPAKDKSVSDLIKRADDALYAAKQQGRNRVVAAGGLSGQNSAGGASLEDPGSEPGKGGRSAAETPAYPKTGP
jgi:hypothetical protein